MADSRTDPTDLTAFLRLRTAEDAARAFLRVVPGWTQGALSLEAATSFLDARGLRRESRSEHAVVDLLARCHAAPAEEHEALVASGRAPTHGEPGRFEWSAEVAADIERAAATAGMSHADDQQTIQPHRAPVLSAEDADECCSDYYGSSPFVVLRRGQIVGRMLPPTDGVDGTDVFGSIIPARSGTPSATTLSDRFETDARGVVRSLGDGLLVLNGPSVSLHDTLSLPGAVDFSTGNIDFPGRVRVAGPVRDRFRVSCVGDLEIAGLAEACHLSTLGALTLDRGMAGRGIGSIRCGGDAEVRYLEAVRGVIGGNLRAKGELTNCSLLVEGRLEAAGCAVRGGQLVLARGGVVGSLGSAAATPTVVSLGRMPGADDLLDRADTLRPELDAAITRHRTVQDRLRQLPMLKPDEIERLMDAEHRERTLSVSSVRLESAAGELRSTLDGYTIPELTVRGSIFRKATVLLPGWRIDITADQRGPLTLRLDNASPAAFHTDSGEPMALAGFASVEHADAQGRSFVRAA